ncbi:MAG TPA: hypothetical protein VL133_02035, partial [Devosia sp.]|nr:hypothetical protein [Devosia sp.]
MRNHPSFARSAGTPAQPKSPGIRPALFYGMFTVLLAGNALTGTAFLLAPDISRLYNGQTEQVVEAYEDRIAQLRVEVDRLHSRSFAQTGDINLQLQELSQQQEVLQEQHQLVQVLVDKADQLGIATATLPTRHDQATVTPVTASGNPDIAATAQALDQMMGPQPARRRRAEGNGPGPPRGELLVHGRRRIRVHGRRGLHPVPALA